MTTTDLVALIKKHPIGVGCGLVGVVCAVLLYVRAGAIATSQAELEKSSTEASKMIANVRNANGLTEQLAEMQTLGKEVDARLMKAGQLAVNLQYFYKLETENEVKMEARQNTLSRNAKAQFVGVPFTVSVQGPYANVMNFLNRLQNGRHFCRINTANITKSGDTGENISLALTLELLGQP